MERGSQTLDPRGGLRPRQVCCGAGSGGDSGLSHAALPRDESGREVVGEKGMRGTNLAHCGALWPKSNHFWANPSLRTNNALIQPIKESSGDYWRPLEEDAGPFADSGVSGVPRFFYQCYGGNFDTSKFISGSPNPQCDCIWSRDKRR